MATLFLFPEGSLHRTVGTALGGSNVGNNILPFVPRIVPFGTFSQQDRRDIHGWSRHARRAAHYNLDIHQSNLTDDRQPAEYLLAHRNHTASSSWGFIREGESIRVWNTITFEDFAFYRTMAASLHSALEGESMR